MGVFTVLSMIISCSILYIDNRRTISDLSNYKLNDLLLQCQWCNCFEKANCLFVVREVVLVPLEACFD